MRKNIIRFTVIIVAVLLSIVLSSCIYRGRVISSDDQRRDECIDDEYSEEISVVEDTPSPSLYDFNLYLPCTIYEDANLSIIADDVWDENGEIIIDLQINNRYKNPTRFSLLCISINDFVMHSPSAYFDIESDANSNYQIILKAFDIKYSELPTDDILDQINNIMLTFKIEDKVELNTVVYTHALIEPLNEYKSDIIPEGMPIKSSKYTDVVLLSAGENIFGYDAAEVMVYNKTNEMLSFSIKSLAINNLVVTSEALYFINPHSYIIINHGDSSLDSSIYEFTDHIVQLEIDYNERFFSLGNESRLDHHEKIVFDREANLCAKDYDGIMVVDNFGIELIASNIKFDASAGHYYVEYFAKNTGDTTVNLSMTNFYIDNIKCSIVNRTILMPGTYVMWKDYIYGKLDELESYEGVLYFDAEMRYCHKYEILYEDTISYGVMIRKHTEVEE